MNIKGYACHFNKRNANGEIVTPDSFKQTLSYYKNHDIKVPINYNHNSDMIIGHVEHFYTANDGLYIDATLNEEVDTVKNFVLPLVKDGTLKCFSTEGYIKKSDIERVNHNTYIAHNFDLRAIAVVNLPADIDAQFVTNSFHDDNISVFNAFPDDESMVKNTIRRAFYVV